MSRIAIIDAPRTERVMPTFARHAETGDFYLIHNTHIGKDAITWAVNMNTNGERFRYDTLDHSIHKLDILKIGTTLSITV